MRSGLGRMSCPTRASAKSVSLTTRVKVPSAGAAPPLGVGLSLTRKRYSTGLPLVLLRGAVPTIRGAAQTAYLGAPAYPSASKPLSEEVSGRRKAAPTEVHAVTPASPWPGRGSSILA